MLTVLKKKVLVDSRFSLNIVDTRKYGRQLQLQSFGGKLEEWRRVSEKHPRIEIFLPIDALSDLADLFLDLALRLRGLSFDG